MTVGEKIREARIKAGLTQKEVGIRSGIAEPTIRRYEHGLLNPKIETIQKIAESIGVPLSMIVTLETEKPELYTIWRDCVAIGEITLYPWQAIQANERNEEVRFSREKMEG